MSLEVQVNRAVALAQRIDAAISSVYAREARGNAPHASTRPTEIGHPCDLRLYLLRTLGPQREIDERGRARMRVGRVLEHDTAKLLREAGDALAAQGFEVRDWTEAVADESLQVRGRIDLWIVDADRLAPVEVKSCAPHIFERLHTFADVLTSKHSWIRKYPAQITMYLMMPAATRQADYGILFLRCTDGRHRSIPVTLDLEYAEELFQRAERVRDAVKSSSPPPRPEHDEQACGGCDFWDRCWSEERAKGDALALVEDGEVVAAVRTCRETKPIRDRYEAAREYLGSRIKATEFAGAIVCDGAVFKRRVDHRKGYTVPAKDVLVPVIDLGERNADEDASG